MGMVFFLVTTFLLLNFVSAREIRIAHLLPMDANTVYESHVMQMCISDLKNRSILPKEMNLKIFTMESCNKFSGIEHAAYLHYMKNASVYFGPGCNNEMLAIGRLASRWNVPIIAHLSGDDALSDRHIYDTLGSVALTSATEMARATLTFLKLYGWKQVGFVKSSINFDRLSLHSLKNLLIENGISINVEVEFDQYMSPEEMIASGQLKLLKNNARVIIVELGLDLHTARNFMVAARRYGINTPDFVYIVPWLAHLYDHYPWEASNVNKDEVKAAFDQTILITAHGYDLSFIEEFEKRFSQTTGIISNRYATISYMSLYDALFLYGLALRDAYDETHNSSIYLDGKFIWHKMTARQFNGMTGQVLMNKKAIRVPSYATYLVQSGVLKIVVELTARLGDKQKCEITPDDCTEHVAHEMIPNFWDSYNGKLPADVPKCGFDDLLCDYTRYYVAVGTILAISGLIAAIIFGLQKSKERRLYEMTWRIPREHLQVLTRNSKSCSTSLASVNTGSWTEGEKADARIGAQQGLSNGVKVAFKRYQQNRNLNFSKSDLSTLKDLKMLEHENLNKFFGVCFNQQNEFIVSWVLCQRGSLEDVIFNTEIKINRNFQVSFAKDVIKGLQFLHYSPIKYHGLLCIQNCLVDCNWSIRLTNFGIEEIIADKLKHKEITHFKLDSGSKKETNKKDVKGEEDEDDSEVDEAKIEENAHKKRLLTDKKYVQQAPEIIRELLNTQVLPPGSPQADIYALGMVLYQILFKLYPFYERDESVNKIMAMIALAGDTDLIIRPSFPDQRNTSAQGDENYSLELLSCIESCWLEIPEIRPNIKKVRSTVNSHLRSTSSGTLVDQMMRMMEDYTTNLEQIVRSRTALLEETQAQADRLLKNLLPPSIAEDLKVGRAVTPQLYATSTILFSDIRGFTKISSMSTPLQVVNFLNDMFSGFDAIIAEHDAYKVETIGDAYMIASGVPKENGNAHVMHMAEIAIKMRKFIKNFKLSHRPEESLMVRIGFHSGSVAAGVVGLNAPRYCLFGDTVHMASRMESSGVPNKIQISKASYNYLHCYYPQFVVEPRGKIEIKNKGQFETWFLEGKNDDAWVFEKTVTKKEKLVF